MGVATTIFCILWYLRYFFNRLAKIPNKCIVTLFANQALEFLPPQPGEKAKRCEWAGSVFLHTLRSGVLPAASSLLLLLAQLIKTGEHNTGACIITGPDQCIRLQFWGNMVLFSLILPQDGSFVFSAVPCLKARVPRGKCNWTSDIFFPFHGKGFCFEWTPKASQILIFT